MLQGYGGWFPVQINELKCVSFEDKKIVTTLLSKATCKIIFLSTKAKNGIEILLKIQSNHVAEKLVASI